MFFFKAISVQDLLYYYSNIFVFHVPVLLKATNMSSGSIAFNVCTFGKM